MAWLFGKKKERLTDLSLLSTDIHSHLIPGIDDGAQNMDQTIELVKALHELGYKKLIITPHIREDSFENDPTSFGHRLQNVQKAVADAGIEMQFDVGAEHTMDDLFTNMMQDKKLKSFGDGYLLIEFPFFSLPVKLKEQLFDLQLDGYKLILAHPERYAPYLGKDKQTLEDLKSRDILFQMNILSLDGYYGPQVQRFARYMAKNDMIDIIGTDLHNLHHIDMIKKAMKNTDIQDLILSGRLINNKF